MKYTNRHSNRFLIEYLFVLVDTSYAPNANETFVGTGREYNFFFILIKIIKKVFF